MNRRGKALKWIEGIRTVIGAFMVRETAIRSLIDDYGAALAVVDFVGEHLDQCPPEVQAAFREYEEGQ